jgi:hypothetical protein
VLCRRSEVFTQRLVSTATQSEANDSYYITYILIAHDKLYIYEYIK